MPTSATLEYARKRRVTAARTREARIEWYDNEVADKITMTMRQRVGLAVNLLRSRVVVNISKPVRRNSSGRVIERSKPGEFPRAETGQLMKNIHHQTTSPRRHVVEGIVFVPNELHYAAILELWKPLDRNFLARTLNENRDVVTRILTGPIG